jgi:tyrosine-protein kinase Etk/Wzc
MNTDSRNLSKPSSKQEDDDIDLMALLFVILRGWKIIVFFAVLGLVIGILYSRYINPTFKSDALIQIEQNSQGISALGSDVSDLIGSEASKAQTEAELIRSRMILEPVVNLLHLRIRLSDPTIGYLDRIKSNVTSTQINTPEGVAIETENGQAYISQFNVSQAYLDKSFTLTRSATGFILSNGFDEFKGQFNQPHQFSGSNGQIQITVADLPVNAHPISITKQSLQNTTNAINSALTVTEKGQQTGIIQLSMTGLRQQQVTLVLRHIVLSYIDQNQSRGSQETTKTIQFMETQIPTLKKKLEDSERTFNKFREKSGTIDVGQEAGILLTENSQIDAQLNELKLKKADLTTYYTEDHPLVIQINEQLAVLNARKNEIDNTIAGLPEVQREFLQLSEDTAINREIYLTLLKNYEQLKIVKAGQIGFARIIDLPISTYKAIAPKKLQIIVLALLLGAMLGTMLVLLKNLLRNVVKDPERIETKTGVPVIATIPRSPLLWRIGKSKQGNMRLLAHVDHSSLSYEAIKSLRTSLIFSMPNQSKNSTVFEVMNGSNRESVRPAGKVILIAGESPGVGKSFISANLSEVFAQLNKKVLVIDGDMRLGELHKMFNLSQDNGLADYLIEGRGRLGKVDTASIAQSASELNIKNFIHPTGVDDIDFIPRGRHPHNPASLLMSDRFTQLMTTLKTHYDYIVIDSPPVLAASDAVILAQSADKVLMVARYDKSIEGQVTYAVKQMHKANMQVDGIILNDVQRGLMDKYSYHYNYAYGDTK